MIANPSVSIIMNCFNSERYLEESIDSIFFQSFEDWEIIFWDNCSTDDSAAIAKSYGPRLKYFLAEKHTDLGIARNLALNKAKGKYLGFLDCDDLFLKDKLKKQVAFMEKNNYVMSYGSSIIIDSSGNEVKRRITKNNSGNIFGKLLRHYEINMQSVLINRSVLVGENLNFDINLKFNPDYNLFMKIAALYPVGVLQDPLVKYRVLRNSLSSQTLSIAADENRYTLDALYKGSDDVRVTYKTDFGKAYAKLHYYCAVDALYSKERIQALKALSPVIFKKIEYFILSILLIIGFPISIILKILGR